MNSIINILLFIDIFITAANAQAGNKPNLILPPGRSPPKRIVKKPGVKPARTIADTAQEYWIVNQCKYPPKAFFSMFREACDVRLRSETFPAGVCQAFFNSSKNLCKLEGAAEDEVQTMLSIHELQSKMDDDEVCDTLAEMKENNPKLFPRMADFTEKEKWFRSIASLIFSPETCSNACSLGALHPVCFGYMLNYNYIGSLPSPLSEDDNAEEETDEETHGEDDRKDDVKANQDKNESSSRITADAPHRVQTSRPVGKSSSQFRQNPKLIGSKFSDPEHYLYSEDIDDLEDDSMNNPVKVNKTPISLVDILELDSMGLDNSAEDDTDDYVFDPDIPIENLPQISQDFLMKIGSVPVSRHKLRGYVGKMDRSEEMPMLSVVLAISGILAVVCFFLLFSVRKKIGIYVKLVRQRHRNNWNYERVFAVQPDDEDYYE